MSAGGSDMPGGGCITAGEVRPGQRQGEEARRDPTTLSVGGLLQAPASSSWDGPGSGHTEPYLGWAGLHSFPPEAGLWGLQDKEGVGR